MHTLQCSKLAKSCKLRSAARGQSYKVNRWLLVGMPQSARASSQRCMVHRSTKPLLGAQNQGPPIWGFPRIRGTILMLGVPIIRIIVFWGPYWGPPVYGNYHVLSTPAGRAPGCCPRLHAVSGHVLWDLHDAVHMALSARCAF